jgi:hypothetical protein
LTAVGSNAATVATVGHAVTDDGQQVSGVVPDAVAAVRVETTSGERTDVPVSDNVFVAWIPAPEQSASISWVMRNGAVVRKVP